MREKDGYLVFLFEPLFSNLVAGVKNHFGSKVIGCSHNYGNPDQSSVNDKAKHTMTLVLSLGKTTI